MKLCLLAAAALTISAPACFAKQAPGKPPAARTSTNTHKVASGIGLDGQDTALFEQARPRLLRRSNVGLSGLRSRWPNGRFSSG